METGEGGQPGGCGCKGVRSCLLCEAAPPPQGPVPQKSARFVYCPLTGFAVGEMPLELAGWTFPFPGVILLEDFVSVEEELQMVELMDQNAWKPSQSGRRKQDYGPKVNFKKRKLKAGHFSGLPSFSQEIVTRMGLYPVLKDFLPVEQCNLDYGPERGSAIDPHWDDWWLWGGRLVSLNLLSATVLSMSCDVEESLQLFRASVQQSKSSESLDCTQGCQSHRYTPAEGLSHSPIKWETDSSLARTVPSKEVVVAVRLPPRSLVVLHGPARYKWKHAIYRDHIQSRRVCVTFRELSAEFGPRGEQEDLGKKLLETALTFQGTPV